MGVSHSLHCIHIKLYHQSRKKKEIMKLAWKWKPDKKFKQCVRLQKGSHFKLNRPDHQAVKPVWLQVPTVDLPGHTEGPLFFFQKLEDFGPLVQQPKRIVLSRRDIWPEKKGISSSNKSYLHLTFWGNIFHAVNNGSIIPHMNTTSLKWRK